MNLLSCFGDRWVVQTGTPSAIIRHANHPGRHIPHPAAHQPPAHIRQPARRPALHFHDSPAAHPPATPRRRCPRRPARLRRSRHGTNGRRMSESACSGVLMPPRGKPFQISKTHLQRVTSRDEIQSSDQRR